MKNKLNVLMVVLLMVGVNVGVYEGYDELQVVMLVGVYVLQCLFDGSVFLFKFL